MFNVSNNLNRFLVPGKLLILCEFKYEIAKKNQYHEMEIFQNINI